MYLKLKLNRFTKIERNVKTILVIFLGKCFIRLVVIITFRLSRTEKHFKILLKGELLYMILCYVIMKCSFFILVSCYADLTRSFRLGYLYFFLSIDCIF